jgi:hypothetical protein
MKKWMQTLSVIVVLAGPSALARDVGGNQSVELGDKVIVLGTPDGATIQYGIWAITGIKGNTLTFGNSETRTIDQVVALKSLNPQNSCSENQLICSCDAFFKDALSWKVVAVLPPDLIRRMGQMLPNVAAHAGDMPLRQQVNLYGFHDVVSINESQYFEMESDVKLKRNKGDDVPYVESFNSMSFKIERRDDPQSACFHQFSQPSVRVPNPS